jgi:hypothetical protein
MSLINLPPVLILLATFALYGQTAVDSKAAAQTPAAAGYSLKITPPPSPVHLGTDIEITVTVTVGNHDIWWTTERPQPAYRAFRVHLSKSGREVEKTKFHRSLVNELRPDDVPENLTSSSVVAPVKSGTSFSMKINLIRLYQITDPGSYVVSVSRYDEDTKTTVESNTVTLDITR